MPVTRTPQQESGACTCIGEDGTSRIFEMTKDASVAKLLFFRLMDIPSASNKRASPPKHSAPTHEPAPPHRLHMKRANLGPSLIALLAILVPVQARSQAADSKPGAADEASQRVKNALEALDSEGEERRERLNVPADWVYVFEPSYELGLTQTGGGHIAYRFRSFGSVEVGLEREIQGSLSPSGDGKYVDTGTGWGLLKIEGKPGAKNLRASLTLRAPSSPDKKEEERTPPMQNFALSSSSMEERQMKRFNAVIQKTEKEFAKLRGEVPSEIFQQINEPREWASALRKKNKDPMGVTSIDAWDKMLEAATGRLELLTVFSGRVLLPGLSGVYKDFDGGALALRETPEGIWFALDVIRGRNAHTGALRGLAQPKGNGRYFYREDFSSQRYDTDPPAEISIQFGSYGQVSVSESHAYRHHGMSATFNGTYQKVEPRIDRLDKEEKGVFDLAQKGDSAFGAGRTKEMHSAYLRCATSLGGGEPLACILENTRGNAAALVGQINRAKKGSPNDMQYALAALSSLRESIYVDPVFALKVYRLGSAINPLIFDSEGTSGGPFSSRFGPEEVPLLEIAAECPPFDVDAFLRKNRLSKADLEASPYVFWELAEEASRGGRFGPPDAKLAFALVLRGGGDIAERTQAIKLAHSLWKAPTTGPFLMATCLSSAVGRAYLAKRNDRAADPAPITADMISESLKDPSQKRCFEKALAAATELFEAESKQFSGSRGFFETRANRARYLKTREQSFLQEVSRRLKGGVPENVAPLEKSDAVLGSTYTQAMRWLAVECRVFSNSDPAMPDTFQFDGPEDLRAVQRLWVKYRDRSAELFAKMIPTQPEHFWKSWMTQSRTAELTRLMEQAGVPAQTLEPLREENLVLQQESLRLYKEYKQQAAASPPQGLVRTGIRPPEDIHARSLAQSNGMLQTVFEDKEILQEEHGAFAQIYNLLTWNFFLKAVNRYSRAVLGCNPPELAGNPSGYYEDFEGGAVCVVQNGSEFSVSTGCWRAANNQSAAVQFRGVLKDEVISSGSEAAGQKDGPRLIVGRGMVCIEPGTDPGRACLANTYVRVGALTETGALLASKVPLGLQKTADSEENRRNTQEFHAAGIRFFNPSEPRDPPPDILEETWKRFRPVREALNAQNQQNEKK